jgi:hypothetical protein
VTDPDDMTKKPRLAKAKEKLNGYRDAIDLGPERNDESVGPLPIEELDVLDMADETRRELDNLKGPLRYVLDHAFVRARQANLALIKCDPFDCVSIGKHQDEVQRFYDLKHWVFSILSAGRFVEQKHTAEQIDEARQLLHDAGQGD